MESTYRGDINEDGKVNIFDLLEMLKLIGSEPANDKQRQIANVDKSADGKVNIFDLLALLKLLGGGEPEVIYWGPAISGLSRLSAAAGDTVGVGLINFDASITADMCKAYAMDLEAEITGFSLDSLKIIIPTGFGGGEVTLVVAGDTTNGKYLNLIIRQPVTAGEGGKVSHPAGVSVEIPAGALTADVAITVELPTTAELEEMNIAADTTTTIVLFGPSESEFADSVTVALPWPKGATSADSLGAQYYNQTSGKWAAAGITSSDTALKMVYVRSDRLSAFKAVETQTIQVRFLTTSQWASFRLASGGSMRLHHVISLSENAVAAVFEGDSILLSQATEQSESGNINLWTQERVELLADVSINVPDMAGELEFNINQSSVEGAWTNVSVANYIGGEANNREDFWWAGYKDLHPWPYTKTVKIAAAELFSQSPSRVPVAVDPTTLDKKVLLGYQGWYLCPGDGSDLENWQSWGQAPLSEYISFDHWPDMSEFPPEERFATDLTLPDGRPAELFSSYPRKTVDRHFKWMEDYDLDGVFYQGRDPDFPEDLSHTRFCKKNKVLENVRAAAEAHGRVFSMELGWDLARHPLEDFKLDWMFIVDVLKITESPNFLRNNGKPVVAIQAIDEWDNMETYAQLDSLVRWFKTEAEPRYQVYLLGCPHEGWFDVDADTKTRMYPAYRSFDGLYPWFERHTYWQEDCNVNLFLLPGLAEASAFGLDYMPVIYPGFSVYNRNEQVYDNKFNMLPRLGGKFLWLKAYDAISAGANMLYIAMFDEMNEGTPMLKLAKREDMPLGVRLLPLDADGYDLPGDWYLRVAREIGRMMRGEIPLSPELPLTLPAYNPNLDITVKPDVEFVSIPGGTFVMGDDNSESEAPAHTVTVGSFQISRHEITNAQYAAFLNQVLGEEELTWISKPPSASGVDGGWLCDQSRMFADFTSSYDSNNRCWISYDEANGFTGAPGKEVLPVVYVTWYGARVYARRYGFDLPTEAEWEYACRGGTQSEYGTDTGTLSSSKANYGESLGRPVAVGSYQANPFGLYDMSGNVSEWCKDWYGSYSSGTQSNPQGPDTGTERVRRGGNWLDGAEQCRAASRSSGDPGTTSYGYNTGFRVVKRSE